MASPDGVDDRQIGQVLRSLRVTSGLSLQQLSEKTGAHLQSIARYEKGEATIPAAFIYEAAKVLNVPPGAFFGETGSGPSGVSVLQGASAPSQAEVKELVRAWRRIPDDLVRHAVRMLVTRIADARSRDA
jgi:transcriptional regulator with XRE-family HTH domain